MRRGLSLPPTSLAGVPPPVSGPTRQEYEVLVTAVRRLAAAFMWSRGKVMAKEDDLGERIPECIVEQTVEIAGSSCDTTSADVAAVVKSASEARPLGIARHSAFKAPELAVSAREAGSSCPGAIGATSADATAAAKSAGGARLHGIVKHSAPTASELAVSTGAAGSLWPGKQDTTINATTAVVKPAGEARTPNLPSSWGSRWSSAITCARSTEKRPSSHLLPISTGQSLRLGRAAPNSQSLLMKFDLQSKRHDPVREGQCHAKAQREPASIQRRVASQMNSFCTARHAGRWCFALAFRTVVTQRTKNKVERYGQRETELKSAARERHTDAERERGVKKCRSKFSIVFELGEAPSFRNPSCTRSEWMKRRSTRRG